MPFKSKAQQRFMFAAEADGELPKGTAKHWADATKKKKGGIKALPEKVETKEGALSSFKETQSPEKVGSEMFSTNPSQMVALIKQAYEVGVQAAMEELAKEAESPTAYFHGLGDKGPGSMSAMEQVVDSGPELYSKDLVGKIKREVGFDPEKWWGKGSPSMSQAMRADRMVDPGLYRGGVGMADRFTADKVRALIKNMAKFSAEAEKKTCTPEEKAECCGTEDKKDSKSEDKGNPFAKKDEKSEDKGNPFVKKEAAGCSSSMPKPKKKSPADIASKIVKTQKK
jgi:hypothetical protein